MNRPGLAFLVAPLWVPLVYAPYAALAMFPSAGQAHLVVISTIFSALFAYAGAALFGVPTYRLLRRKPRLLLAAAILVGFAAGGLMWLVFLILVALLLGSTVIGFLSEFWYSPGGAHWVALAYRGALGALVGLTMWFIGRPKVS